MAVAPSYSISPSVACIHVYPFPPVPHLIVLYSYVPNYFSQDCQAVEHHPIGSSPVVILFTLGEISVTLDFECLLPVWFVSYMTNDVTWCKCLLYNAMPLVFFQKIVLHDTSAFTYAKCCANAEEHVRK